MSKENDNKLILIGNFFVKKFPIFFSIHREYSRFACFTFQIYHCSRFFVFDEKVTLVYETKKIFSRFTFINKSDSFSLWNYRFSYC